MTELSRRRLLSSAGLSLGAIGGLAGLSEPVAAGGEKELVTCQPSRSRSRSRVCYYEATGRDVRNDHRRLPNEPIPVSNIKGFEGSNEVFNIHIGVFTEEDDSSNSSGRGRRRRRGGNDENYVLWFYESKILNRHEFITVPNRRRAIAEARALLQRWGREIRQALGNTRLASILRNINWGHLVRILLIAAWSFVAGS